MPERFPSFHATLGARLDRFRGNMSDEAFAQLIDDVIRTMLRFEEIEARERASMSISTLQIYKEPEPRNPA